MKKIFIALLLLFCAPSHSAGAPETPAQTQEKIAGFTATINELKTQLNGLNAQRDPTAHQEVSEKLMNNYVFRGRLYYGFKEWKSANHGALLSCYESGAWYGDTVI